MKTRIYESLTTVCSLLIVSSGLTPSFLRWKGIEATAKLSASPNAKIVVIGSGKDGLPLILGGDN